MKYFLAALAFLFTSKVDAQPKQAKAASVIENVTIFSSGARVERSANIALTAGRTEITFSALSSQLDPQSVQLTANQNITLLSVQATKDFLSQRKTDQQEKAFISTVDSLRESIETEKKMLDVYRNEENMLIKNEAIGGQAGVKPGDLKEALDLHRQRLTEVYKKQLEIEKSIRQKEKELLAFESQLKEFSKKKDSVDYVVTAVVESKTTGTVNFKLLYNVKDAGWYPSYDVRVQSISAPLSFLMNANVFQRSGESWKNVSLWLSTGDPKENATSPELQPWRINFDNPLARTLNVLLHAGVTGRITSENGEPIAGASVVVRGTALATMADVNGFFKLNNVTGGATLQVSAVGFESKELPATPGYITVVLQESAAKLEEVVVTGFAGRAPGILVRGQQSLNQNKKSIQTVDVTTQYQPTTLLYKIDEKYSIETDGKTTTIGIKAFDVAAGYQYFSVPKIDASSFLTAQIADWHDYDLQSGEANLYYEGSYLGKTYIDLSEMADTLNLSLGKDNGVKVSRKNVKEYTSRRLIGTNKTESRQFEIHVRNTKREPVQITLQDQFPVSTIKEISVIDTKAPGAKVNEETGIVTWDLNLAPGEERKLTLSYTVRYPRDRKLVLE